MQLRVAILLIIMQTFLSITSDAQSKRGIEWVTGRGSRIKFENNSITTKFNWIVGPNGTHYFQMGNSNICDTAGNLNLCSDGYNIYDSAGNYIDGGDTLVPFDFYIDQDGWSAYSQSSIFLPLDSNKYYFVTPTMSDLRFADCIANNHCNFDLLLYNLIDMNANGGAGKVTKRMVPLMENAELRKTQMMACRHSNGKDWWLLKHGGDSNAVYKFLLHKTAFIIMAFSSLTFLCGVNPTRGVKVLLARMAANMQQLLMAGLLAKYFWLILIGVTGYLVIRWKS